MSPLNSSEFLNFSKNIILKFSALKCFHVEIMMEGTE